VQVGYCGTSSGTAGNEEIRRGRLSSRNVLIITGSGPPRAGQLGRRTRLPRHEALGATRGPLALVVKPGGHYMRVEVAIAFAVFVAVLAVVLVWRTRR
jgi:Flp pilus assembly protein TadB